MSTYSVITLTHLLFPLQIFTSSLGLVPATLSTGMPLAPDLKIFSRIIHCALHKNETMTTFRDKVGLC